MYHFAITFFNMRSDRRQFLQTGGLAAAFVLTGPVATIAVSQTAAKQTDDFRVVPSKTSSEKDFDFLVGSWTVKNKMLKARLSNSKEWLEFDSTLDMHKTINGLGNVEAYKSVSNGKPFEGMAVRLFDPKTRFWSVYWCDSNNPVMDSNPVVGSFENGVGKLYAKDDLNGKPVISLYQWDSTDSKHPIWSQALSPDAGKTWEWNWYMTLSRKA